jgi:hypothetical protein
MFVVQPVTLSTCYKELQVEKKIRFSHQVICGLGGKNPHNQNAIIFNHKHLKKVKSSQSSKRNIQSENDYTAS